MHGVVGPYLYVPWTADPRKNWKSIIEDVLLDRHGKTVARLLSTEDCGETVLPNVLVATQCTEFYIPQSSLAAMNSTPA